VPHLTHSNTESKSQTASQLVQPYFHSSRQRVAMAILYNGPPFPVKIAPSHGESGPMKITHFNGGSEPPSNT